MLVKISSYNQKGHKMKNKVLLILLIIAAAILGGIAAAGASNVDNLQWLAYSKGIELKPSTLDLSIISLTFGFSFKINVAQIICMLIAVAVYPKLAKAINV